jgi:hypothetical protein
VDSGGDRGAHFAVWIRIERECNWEGLKVFGNFLGAMTQDYDNRFDTAFAKIVDTAFDNGFVCERQEGLRGAHAPGPAGGEQHC